MRNVYYWFVAWRINRKYRKVYADQFVGFSQLVAELEPYRHIPSMMKV